MPYNFKGKYYDARPKVDEFGWLVIKDGLNIGRFKLDKKTNKLESKFSGHYHIDVNTEYKMKKRARIIITKMREAGKDI